MKIVKSKLVLITMFIVAALALSVYFATTNIFASKTNISEPKTKPPQLPEGARLLTKDEINEIVNSEEYEMAKEKTEKKLEDAWNDIASTFDISASSHVRMTLEDFSSNDLEKKYSQFASEEFKKIYHETYHDFKSKRKIGWLKPIIFAKIDGSELIFASKDGDGNNTIVKSSKCKNKWETTTQTKEGKKPMNIEN